MTDARCHATVHTYGGFGLLGDLLCGDQLYLISMYHTSIDYLDRLRAKNIFKGAYTTLLGVICSLVLVAGILAFLLPTIVAFFKGSMYFQSEFSLQQAPYGNITVSKDFRTALVFYNKTDNKVANHTLLRQYLTVVTYQTSATNAPIKSDTILSVCDTNYFQNTLNPPQNFDDCIIFVPNAKVDISYSPSRGFINFGFYSFANCLDPFYCQTNSTLKNASLNNFSSVFNNFTYTLYFTSRILQPDGTFKDQVFSISSSNFNTPFTITSDSFGELQIKNTTMDDSILPWFNYKQKMGPVWYGTMSSNPKNTTFTSQNGTRTGFTISRYQNQVYRFYKKVDWLLGIIGGTMFLFFVVFYIPLYNLNQLMKQTDLVQEFFVRHKINVTDQIDGNKLVLLENTVHLQKIQQSWLQFLKKLLPWYQSREGREWKREFDIAGLIKMLKVAERNLKNQNIPFWQKPRQLVISTKREEPDKENKQLSVQNQQQSLVVINNEDRVAEQMERRNQPRMQEEIAEERLPERLPQTESRLAGRADIDSQTIEKYSSFLRMHPQVVEAVIKSENIAQLMAVNLTLMALAGNKEDYRKLCQVYKHSKEANSKESCGSSFSKCLFDIIRSFDVFGIQPQFNLGSAGSTIFGCLIGVFILGISILFFYFIMFNAMNYQNYVQYDFQDASQINYTLVTGVGFRPFFCVNTFSAYTSLTSANPSVQLTFFYNTPSQRVTIPLTNLNTGMHSYLGISPDSPYASINTNYCFVMQDNISIPMGGYNTSNQAYFGFRIDPYCLGTVDYCQSINSTLRTRIISFLSSSTTTFTLYLPFNTFDPQTRTLSGGGVYPQIIRQGTSGVSITSGVVQTLYVSAIQLIDDYSMRFLGIENPPVLQQSLTTDRYQQSSNIQGVTSSMPYYEVRVRPSGQVTKVVLTGTPSDVVLGVIGGICVIFYAFFHRFAKIFDHYNARCHLALQVYGEQAISSSFLHKLLVLLLPECLCRYLSEQTSESILRDKQVDRVIQYQLNHSEFMKQCISIYQLSTAGYSNFVEKYLALIYFKQAIPEDYLSREPPQQQQKPINQQDQAQFVGLQEQSDHSQSQAEMRRSQRRVANLQEENGNHNQEIIENYEGIEREAQRLKEIIEEVEPYNPHRSPYAPKESNSFMQFMDWFSTKPSFTFNGSRRIRSVFGSCLFFGMVASIIILVLYEIKAYVSGSNSTISFQKYVIPDISNEPGFVLNSSNFRLAMGFHLNPNVSLVNVSSLVNSSSNVIITVSQVNLVRDNITGLLTQTQTEYQLVPCTNNYFDNFKDQNTDYTFLNGLSFGWCLPLNLTLNLTPFSSRNVMQYFTMKITSKANDTTTLNNLRTLTNTYVVALYMTLPQLDLASKTFKYSVKQIRGFPNPSTRSMQYNVTLTKQQIIYTTPNYTLNPPQNVVSSYAYLNNKNSQRTYLVTNTSLPRTYNITFSYLGLVEQYVFKQPNANEIVGVIGGLIALFYAVAYVIAQSFNTYKFRYLLGKQLYLIKPAESNVQSREKKKDLLEDQLRLQDSRDKDYQVEFNEFELFIFWILSFFCGCRCFKKLTIISLLQEKADEALNLRELFVKKAKLKDTLNKQYFLQANKTIKVTNLFSKLPIMEEEVPFQLQFAHKDFLNKHGLSSFDQYILSLTQKQQQYFEKVYRDKSLFRKIFYKLESQNRDPAMGEMKKEADQQQIIEVEPQLVPQTTKVQEMYSVPMDSYQNLNNFQKLESVKGEQPLKKESEKAEFDLIEKKSERKEEESKQVHSIVGQQFQMLEQGDFT